MIHVLLTSELTWQRNDAIKIKKLVPPLVESIMAKFEQIL